MSFIDATPPPPDLVISVGTDIPLFPETGTGSGFRKMPPSTKSRDLVTGVRSSRGKPEPSWG
jgi:hypothetical protein